MIKKVSNGYSVEDKNVKFGVHGDKKVAQKRDAQIARDKSTGKIKK